jgi:hypothetical protein
MDALAQLALMTKAKLMFESPDTFLSFPALVPIGYPPEQMNFANAATVQQMQAFADFSTWTNSLPQGTLFPSSPTGMLWNVYRGVLDNSQVAQGSLTPDQTAQLAAAQSFLVTPGPEGVLVDTPQVIAYKQYQQAYFAANQDYNNQSVTAGTSSDARVQSAWKNGGEASARAAVQAAESDWETKGYKAQVEQAQVVERTLGAQSPQLKWGAWSALCNPDIDFPTSPSGGVFGPTLFNPSNVVQQANWPSFSITGGDIPSLISQAPSELKNLFGTMTGTSTIDSLSFDYCSVGLTRPWFRPELFSSRFWRFPDSGVQLSDGKSPPSGDWPAYICAVVFARNITLKTVTPGPTPPPSQVLRNFPVLSPTFLKTAPQSAPRPMPLYLRSGIELARSEAAAPTTVAAVNADRMATSALPAAASQAKVIRPVETTISVSAASAVPTRADAMALNPVLSVRLNAATFSMAASQAAAAGNAAPQPTPTAQTQPVSSDISVLAFICKALPKCPDPDPSLKWG